MKKVIIIVINLLISSCSTNSNLVFEREPTGLKNCLDIINAFFSKQPSELEIEVEQLISKIELNGLPKISSLHNHDDMIFYSLVSERPALLNLLKTYPTNKKDQINWRKILEAKVERYYDSALFNFVDYIERKTTRSDLNATSFLEKQKSTYEMLDLRLKNRLRMDLASLIEDQKLQNYYRQNFYVNLNHDNHFIYIGANKFKYSISNSEIIIEVPRSRVKSPAWNPLTNEQSDRIIQNNTSVPAVYDATLGLDGNFYLLDGNHRFQIRETKEVIKVKISEFKTASLSIFLDLIGASQLKTHEIKSIINQETTVKGFLPENVSETIVFREDEIVRKLE